METPQSPEEEVIKPSETALVHKAERVGVVTLSTVRLGETQFNVKGMPPSVMARFAKGGKAAEGVVNRSRVADPERIEENGGGLSVERRPDDAMLSMASMAD